MQAVTRMRVTSPRAIYVVCEKVGSRLELVEVEDDNQRSLDLEEVGSWHEHPEGAALRITRGGNGSQYVDVVFSGFPDHQPPLFIRCVDEAGNPYTEVWLLWRANEVALAIAG